jgi:cyanate lyase
MKKADLIAQLEGAKALTSVVSIDNVIALIQGLDPEVRIEKVLGMSRELAEAVANKIERILDYNSSYLVDLSTAELELSYNNQIEVNRVDVNVYEIMEHITATLEEFVIEPDEEDETDGFIEAQAEAEQLQRDILAGNEAAQEE